MQFLTCWQESGSVAANVMYCLALSGSKFFDSRERSLRSLKVFLALDGAQCRLEAYLTWCFCQCFVMRILLPCSYPD